MSVTRPQVNSSLTSLNMAQNELGAVGGAAFAAALRRNTGLPSLDLRRNELGPDGGAAIGAAVGANARRLRHTCIAMADTALAMTHPCPTCIAMASHDTSLTRVP